MNVSYGNGGFRGPGPQVCASSEPGWDASRDHRGLACRWAHRGLRAGRCKVGMLFLALVALEAGMLSISPWEVLALREALCQMCSPRGPATMHVG